MTWILGGVVVAGAAVAGAVTSRRVGWDPALHRMTLVALLLPWVAQHGSLVRLSRSASLNPLGRAAGDGAVLAGDWVAPLVLAVLLAACLARPRALRVPSVALPVVASALIWWVTLPLYAGVMQRGWFFLTEELSGPWPFVYHLAASAFLAGWVGSRMGRAEPEAPA